MGIDYDFGLAYYKAELAAGMRLPTEGTVFISVKDRDKNEKMVWVAKKLKELGFKILATEGTAEFLRKHGIDVKVVNKISQGRPNVIDEIINRKIDLIINTPSGKVGRSEGYEIRRAAVDHGIPYITTISGAIAAVKGIEAIKKAKMTIKTIQEYHKEVEEMLKDR
jgi:carbamoyl-phosphate synthase large subunit